MFDILILICLLSGCIINWNLAFTNHASKTEVYSQNVLATTECHWSFFCFLVTKILLWLSKPAWNKIIHWPDLIHSNTNTWNTIISFFTSWWSVLFTFCPTWPGKSCLPNFSSVCLHQGNTSTCPSLHGVYVSKGAVWLLCYVAIKWFWDTE